MFKRTTGESPSQYFIGLKMERAQVLLRETRKAVIEIAFEVGYSNPSHFAQIFRRETGRSPAEYRGNFESPRLFFVQHPGRLSKTASAAALLLWHS
jgi:transcriptional regulator GlxA family with amidase domain